MTSTEFMALCGLHKVDVGIALENEAVKEALLKRDDELVEKLLTEEF